jgi:hypothetical protein
VDIAQDAIAWQVSHGAEVWRIAWHPPPEPPDGTPHGSSAVCWAADQIVLISDDGQRWGFPGGRPEAGEDWLDVLSRSTRSPTADWCLRRPSTPASGSRKDAPIFRRILTEAGLSPG